MSPYTQEEDDLLMYWQELSETAWFREHPVLSATRPQIFTDMILSMGPEKLALMSRIIARCRSPTPNTVYRFGSTETGQNLRATQLDFD